MYITHLSLARPRGPLAHMDDLWDQKNYPWGHGSMPSVVPLIIVATNQYNTCQMTCILNSKKKMDQIHKSFHSLSPFLMSS